jgi:hypothetical protein
MVQRDPEAFAFAGDRTFLRNPVSRLPVKFRRALHRKAQKARSTLQKTLRTRVQRLLRLGY